MSKSMNCPYCNHEQDLWEDRHCRDFNLTPDGSTCVGKCESCEKQFLYSVDICFHTEKDIENDEESKP